MRASKSPINNWKNSRTSHFCLVIANIIAHFAKISTKLPIYCYVVEKVHINKNYQLDFSETLMNPKRKLVNREFLRAFVFQADVLCKSLYFL